MNKNNQTGEVSMANKRAIVDGMAMSENNENNEGMKMEKTELFELVKGFVADMDNEGRKEFMKELAKEVRVAFGDDGGRKAEVRELLEQAGATGISIQEMADKLNTTNKNISSILSYLRRDGMKFMTKSDGRKVIEQ